MSAASPSTIDDRTCMSQRHASIIGLVTYCRIVWLDYMCIAIIAALTLGIYFTPMYYFEHRVVPIWSPVLRSNLAEILSEVRLPVDITYPLMNEPLPTWGCGLVVVLVPLLVVAIFQLKTWSLWDLHAGVVGAIKAVVSATFTCTILKHVVGGFRPHYIEACKPDWTLIARDVTQGFHIFNATACTGDKYDVRRALQAFPSGHAASSFAAAIFLALYLNAKLKVFSDHASDFWAFIVVLAPLIFASLVSGSMYTSHQHHSHDLIFGMIIGLFLGMLAYRSAYAAVFDFRYNHIPLPPFATKTQFSYSPDLRREFAMRLEKQVVEGDELIVWSWWKQSGAKDEEKEKEMAWLRSIKSLQVTGRELGLKAKPIM